MPTEALIQELRERLPDDFHRQLLDGSLMVLRQSENPVRGHLFAAGLRELFALSLEVQAPENMVSKCEWFKPEANARGPTRRQRALYATRGGLADDFLRDELHIDPEELHSGLAKAFDELHKRTHVRPATLIIDPCEIEDFAERAIDTLNNLFGTIRNFRRRLIGAIEEHLQDEAMDALLRETIASVDLPASHHSIEEVYVDAMHVVDIDAEIIRYEASGKVYVELQWGSSSDFRNVDGLAADVSFPFTCTTAAPVDDPYNFYTQLTEVGVDTRGWHEGYGE
jgi:hypothetical protein